MVKHDTQWPYWNQVSLNNSLNSFFQFHSSWYPRAQWQWRLSQESIPTLWRHDPAQTYYRGQKANRILTEDSLGKFCIHVKVIENKNKKVND